MTKFKLSQRLTVFLGRNNTGKTSIHRALKLFTQTFSDSVLRGILRKGEPEGYVSLYLTDGTKLTVTLTRVKKKNKLDSIQTLFTYIRLSDGQELKRWRFFNHEILDVLHWIVFETKEGTYLLNFCESESKLFVNTSGTLNAMVLECLCKNEYYERKIFNMKNAVEKEERELQNMYKDAQLYSDRVEQSTYTDVSYMEEVKEYYQGLRDAVDLAYKQVKIYKILYDIEIVDKSLNLYSKMLYSVKSRMTSNILREFLEQKRNLDKLNLLKRLIAEKLVQYNLKEVTSSTNKLETFDKLGLASSNLTHSVETVTQVTGYLDKSRLIKELNLVKDVTNISLLSRELRSFIQEYKLYDRYLKSSKIVENAQLMDQIKTLMHNRLCILQMSILKSLIELRSKEVKLKSILVASTALSNKEKIFKLINSVSYNVSTTLQLLCYVSSLDEEIKLNEVSAKIPTCPTCGKVFIQHREGCVPCQTTIKPVGM